MRNTRADSTVIVYFSGRGYRVASGQMTRYYLLPHDYDPNDLEHGSIPVQEFARRLRSIPARKLLVLLDCAHAGGMIEEIAPEIGFEEGLSGADSSEQGKVVIAAARDAEMVYAERPYSVFTQAVLEALSGAQRPMNNTYIRVLDLAAYVQEIVPSTLMEGGIKLYTLNEAITSQSLMPLSGSRK